MRRGSRGVRRGRLTTYKSATCRSLGSAFVAGLFWKRHQALPGARDTIVSTAPVVAWAIRLGRGCGRAKFVPSASASEPELIANGRSAIAEIADGTWKMAEGLKMVRQRRRVQGCKSWRVEGRAPSGKRGRAKRAKFLAKGPAAGWQCRMPHSGLASG